MEPESQKITQKISRRVLVIEDNIAVAESLRSVLELFGHNVYVAYNGYDGVEKAREIKPHFVLCDISLPKIDGYEVAKIFKADKELSSACLIALSGYGGLEDIEKAHAAGFDHYLIKPPDLNTLEQLLLQFPPASP
jgi:CheY-like chemotaxis protein